MKRSKQLLFLGGIAAALLIGACNKNDTEPGPSELNELFESLRSPAQSFTVTAGTEQTITGAQGTKIIFYPNSFKDAAGNTLSSGSVNISLTEVYTPGQMIAHRTTTTTNDDRLLTSGGQVLITAR